MNKRSKHYAVLQGCADRIGGNAIKECNIDKRLTNKIAGKWPMKMKAFYSKLVWGLLPTRQIVQLRLKHVEVQRAKCECGALDTNAHLMEECERKETNRWHRKKEEAIGKFLDEYEVRKGKRLKETVAKAFKWILSKDRIRVERDGTGIADMHATRCKSTTEILEALRKEGGLDAAGVWEYGIKK